MMSRSFCGLKGCAGERRLAYLAQALVLAVEVLGVHGEAARVVRDPLVEEFDEATLVVPEVALEDVYSARLVQVLLHRVRAEHEAVADGHGAFARVQVHFVDPGGPGEDFELVEQHRFARVL